MTNEIKCINVEFEIDFKAGKLLLKDIIPDISENQDYITQYIGIWRIIFDRVNDLQPKKVLEFGTRDGYSTRLFSRFIRPYGGIITTVDMKPPVTPFAEDNIISVTTPVENFKEHGCDILYIDDWHDGHHLYWELNQFAKNSRVVMIHDVCLDGGLMDTINIWCKQNMVSYSIYPINPCGLAILEIERAGLFYANKDKTTSE